MANATGITLNPFSFEGTARQTILDNQSLDKTTPFILHGRVYFEPTDADMNLAAVSSNEGLVTISAITYHAGDQLNPPYYDVVAQVNQNASGVSEITLTESNTSWQDSHNISYQFSGTPRMVFNPSSQTLASGVSVPFVDVPAHYYEDASGMTLAEIAATACSKIDDGDTIPSYVVNQSDNWSGLTNNTPRFFLNSGTTVLVVNNFYENDSTKDRRLRAWFSLQDTSGNTYITDYTLYQEWSGTTPSSYIRFADSAATINGVGVTCTLEVSGCTSTYVSAPFSATGNIDFTYVNQFNNSCGIGASENRGATQLESDLRVEFVDTSGNTYYDTIHVVQPKQVKADFDPATISLSPAPGTASTTAVGVNCTVSSVTFDRILFSGGTWAVDPTFTINGTEVTFQVPENTGNEFRYVMYYFTITDTDGNAYTASFYLGQYNMRVYLDPTSHTHGASTVGSGQFYVKSSGVTINSSYTPTVTLSGEYDWITGTSIDWYTYDGCWRVRYGFKKNLSDHDKVAYITIDGVDTYGVVYDGLVFTATKEWSAYTFLNYDSASASSAASVDTLEVVPVNTTVCSVSVTGSASSTPDLWTGVTQPTVTVLGNYITVNWPENPYTAERNLQLTVEAVWGENCDKATSWTYQKNQEAAATPVQKDIEAEDTDYSVGSGSGNGSTTVQASGCTYESFTYITGGSFSVTATSAPNNTIVFTYPENPTTSPRTGYTYLTYYDGDGNAYGPQTITFTQQAGSSPGPGPQPDPDTGYVYTSFTITDNEQHRFFPEAMPGVTYSAAGQYYRTIPACEARYSLYYVNSYGGVDVLPFKEKSWKKNDTITRFNYSRSFRNNTLEFENVNYMNEIKPSWELHTGWMSDESSQRMHELVESTIVYLYDALEKEYTPVVMTDKKLEYKTYHNQGKKFYNYTVNVEESQSKERR